MINTSLALTYLYLLIYILLSSGVILYNKWVLSPKYFNFPFPITLTMIHMGFSGLVAFILVRVFKVVTPVKMTFEIYATCVVPISAFFASSLWFGNTAYLHISVAFIQMLKALMPVATFLMAVVCGTDKLRCDVFLNMLLVSVGVVVSSYGEIHFNVIGTVYQVTGIFAEALRLVLTQVLLQKKGLTLNPITSLYYIAPCSFVFLFIPWYLLESPAMDVAQIQFNFWIFFSNAICALALNFSIFLVIGRTGAVTIRVAGVLKDWILIALSTVIFPESAITGLNIIGYAIALCGVVMYNYLKVKDVRASQSTMLEKLPERIGKALIRSLAQSIFYYLLLALKRRGILINMVYNAAEFVFVLFVSVSYNYLDNGYALSHMAVVHWNHKKISPLSPQAGDLKFEKKSSDIYKPNDDESKGNDSASELIVDEEAPLMSSSRLSHVGRTQFSGHGS